MRNPFEVLLYGNIKCQTTDVAGRLHDVRNFDLQDCADALHVAGLQKTVRQAIERRQRRLQRERGIGNKKGSPASR